MPDRARLPASRIIARPLDWLSGVIETLETVPLSARAWGTGFVSIVAVRHLLELRSAQASVYAPIAFYAHYTLAYLAPLLALCLILSICSRVALGRVLKLMLFAWGLTLLPPLLDLAAGRPHESRIGYLDPGSTPLATIYLRFFDPSLPLEGTTPGIRIEAAVAVLLGGLYAGIRSRSWLRGLLCGGGVYAASLFFFSLPVLVHLALRPLLPGGDPALLFMAEGRMPRPDPLVRPDQVAMIYLVPLTLLLGGLSAGLAARGDPKMASGRRLLLGAGGAFVRGPGLLWAVLAAVGLRAGDLLLPPALPGMRAAPFDLLAWLAAPLALGLLGTGLEWSRGRDAPDRAPGGFLLAAGALLCWALSAGTLAMAAVALAGGALAAGLSGIPWLRVLAPVASAIGAAGAFLAGWAMYAGLRVVNTAPLGLVVAIAVSAALLSLTAFFRQPRAAGRRQAELRAAEEDDAKGRPGGVPIAAIAAALSPFGVFLLRPPVLPALPVTLALSALAALLFLAGRRAAGGAIAALGLSAGLALALEAPGPRADLARQALSSPRWFLDRSEKAEKAGDLEGALGAAGEAVRRAPEAPEAHHRLGVLRLRRGDTAGAIESLERALRIARRPDANLLTNLGSAMLQAGRPAEALEEFDRALRLEPERLTALFNRANTLDLLGRTSEADTAWQHYLSVAARSPEDPAFIEAARRRLAQGPPPAPQGAPAR